MPFGHSDVASYSFFRDLRRLWPLTEPQQEHDKHNPAGYLLLEMFFVLCDVYRWLEQLWSSRHSAMPTTWLQWNVIPECPRSRRSTHSCWSLVEIVAHLRVCPLLGTAANVRLFHHIPHVCERQQLFKGHWTLPLAVWMLVVHRFYPFTL